MKHTLNVLTLTALAAAASAQTAATDSGLNYNSITVSRAARQNAASLQLALGQTNFVAGVSTSNEVQTETPHGQLSLGYVFKGVTAGIDATIGVIQGTEQDTVYTLEVRRQLNEVYQGLEIAAGYAGTLGAEKYSRFNFGGIGVDSAESAYYLGISYNINKTFAVGVSLNKQANEWGNWSVARQTVYSVRASF